MSKKKVAVILASTVLIASLVIGGTLAYLTSNATVTNTFTMGDVKISLTEPKWDAVLNHGVGMLPGYTVDKDPTVKELKGNSYMRIKMEIVENDGTAITSAPRITLIKGTITGLDTTKFTLDTTRPTPANPSVSYYNYVGILFETDTATLFTGIEIPVGYTNENIDLMGEYKIKLTAEAIQSGNLTQDAAYTALD